MNKTLKNPLTYILFLLPTLILYSVFFIYPVLGTVKIGFTDSNGIQGSFVGLKNYIDALHDEVVWSSFKNNLYFVLFSILIQIPIIVLLGILISEIKRFRGFYKTAVFLPSVMSTAIVSIIWIFVVYHPQIGVLNRILPESLQHNWLGEEGWAMLSILVTNAWQWTGFYVVLVLAAIIGLPKEIFEAASIDGAGGIQKAWRITLPLIRPVIVVIILLSITGAMKAVDIVIVMTNGGPYQSTDVMASYMYKQAFNGSSYGYGNAIGNLIFIFTVILTLIFNGISKKFGES